MPEVPGILDKHGGAVGCPRRAALAAAAAAGFLAPQTQCEGEEALWERADPGEPHPEVDHPSRFAYGS